MAADFVRDHAMYAAIFGLFSTTWFGWAQENPPSRQDEMELMRRHGMEPVEK